MTLKQAIKVLRRHNKWRRGDDSVPETNPKLLGDAIDYVVLWYNLTDEEYYEFLRWRKKNKSGKITVHDFIELQVQCIEALLEQGHEHDYAVKAVTDAYYPYKPEMDKGNYNAVTEMLSSTFLQRKYQTPNLIPRYTQDD